MLGDALEFLCIVLKVKDSGTSTALKSHVILKCSYTSPALQANPWHKTPLCTYRAAMLLFKSLKPLFHKIYKAALCSMGWEIIKFTLSAPPYISTGIPAQQSSPRAVPSEGSQFSVICSDCT